MWAFSHCYAAIELGAGMLAADKVTLPGTDVGVVDGDRTFPGYLL